MQTTVSCSLDHHTSISQFQWVQEPHLTLMHPNLSFKVNSAEGWPLKSSVPWQDLGPGRQKMLQDAGLQGRKSRGVKKHSIVRSQSRKQVREGREQCFAQSQVDLESGTRQEAGNTHSRWGIWSNRNSSQERTYR